MPGSWLQSGADAGMQQQAYLCTEKLACDVEACYLGRG